MFKLEENIRHYGDDISHVIPVMLLPQLVTSRTIKYLCVYTTYYRKLCTMHLLWSTYHSFQRKSINAHYIEIIITNKPFLSTNVINLYLSVTLTVLTPKIVYLCYWYISIQHQIVSQNLSPTFFK